jgi:hypothetical protein
VEVTELTRIVQTLQATLADAESRGPLVAIARRDGVLELIVPPRDAAASVETFFDALDDTVRPLEAAAVAVALPVRTLWAEDHLCDRLDAEAFVVVAAEDFGERVASVGVRCAIHELPEGWTEAHDDLQWLAEPLRRVVGRRQIEDHESH